MAEAIWTAVCEIAVEPGDLPSGLTKGFARVTTWADSRETLREKVSAYLGLYKWQLLSIETAHPVVEERSCDDETLDMITRTQANRQAIILGRFFSYRES